MTNQGKESREALRGQGAGVGEQSLELAGPEEALKVGVAPDGLLLDEGVGDGALAGEGLDGVLKGTAVG